MRKFASILLAVCLMAASAQAVPITIWTGSTYHIEMEQVDVGSGAELLKKSVLTVVNDSGDSNFDPNVFDGVAASAGYTGFTGLLHQQALGMSPTEDAELFGGFNYMTATDIDSHFLVSSGDLSIVTAPSETAGIAPSTEPVDAFALDGGPFAAFAIASLATPSPARSVTDVSPVPLGPSLRSSTMHPWR